MPKTQETIKLEQALDNASRSKREYGCEEVTIGFKHDNHGDEIVDYMSIDSEDIIKCYEIKVTLSDLKTDNKKSFYGHYNYLVISNSLYRKNPNYDNYIPPFVGILVGEDLIVKRKAKKVTCKDVDMLKTSLLRSIFWKYENYKDASNLQHMRDLTKQLDEQSSQVQQLNQVNDRKLWTYDDYEHYYNLNHQTNTNLEALSKIERQEYQLRQANELHWHHQEDSYICPKCKHQTNIESNYCPNCGLDLRKIVIK